MAQHASAGKRGDLLAVVASVSPEDCRNLEQSLGHGGYTTRIVGPGASLVDEVLATRPDILLVDLPTALGHVGSLAVVVEEHPELAGLPVIVLLPEDGIGELPENLTR